jgi:cbb3-type cytochrome oxidase subunit 3
MRWDAFVVFVLALVFFEGLAYMIGKGRKGKRSRSSGVNIPSIAVQKTRQSRER